MSNKQNLRGQVKFFNDTKGFGFITPINEDGKPTGGKDVFVHISGCIDEVKEKDIVTYDTKPGQKGENAINVQIEN